MHHCYDINAIGQWNRAALDFLRCFGGAGIGMAAGLCGASAEEIMLRATAYATGTIGRAAWCEVPIDAQRFVPSAGLAEDERQEQQAEHDRAQQSEEAIAAVAERHDQDGDAADGRGY
jgi:hypothetical protein